MSKDPKIKLKEYTEKKAEGLERIRQSAQSAFLYAQEQKAQGRIDEATCWMDRAHRLVDHNPNITFDLVMLRLKQKQYHEAYDLLLPLMKKFDFYEGWLVLAILLSHLGNLSQAVQKIQYALSHYSPTNQSWSMIRLLVQDANEVGCCALIGSLGQVWIDNPHYHVMSVFLDDELILKTADPFFSLPENWEMYSYLHIEKEDCPLIGSPINIQSIIRTEGFVESDGKCVKGWLWHPAEPDRIPTVNVYDTQGILSKEIKATKEFEVATLEFPLFRAKQFFIPLKEFHFGLYALKDDYGRNLIGSPINPFLLQQKRRQFKDIHKKHQDYLPVSAYYKGDTPAVERKNTLGTVVVIPVYKGKEETILCVQSVLNSLPSGVILQLVNDCSPDAELVEWLEEQVDHEAIYLIHHIENMGFPGAVNTGMYAWPGYDVILLNSDTLVPKGWIENLTKAAYCSENIGTVTPFSNDASIFSYPHHDKENPVPTLKSVQVFMQYLQKIYKNKIIDVPTGHGFCMFIRHDCLSQTGLFRETLFAQGYGEENDFCMRAQHLGWRHVLAADIFVGHKGGVSFQNSKNALLKRNLAILNKLYPDYDEMVMDYIDRDFLRSVRYEIDLYRLQELEKKYAKQGKSLQYGLFITHTYGGGVERAVQERANELRLKGIIPLFIRPTLLGDACRCEIQFKSSSSTQIDIEDLYPNFVFSLPSEYDALLVFLQNRKIACFEVHHFAGHHVKIRHLLQDLGIAYDMYLHDYMSFCPRISLVNADGVYCQEPSKLSVCQKCIGKEHFDEAEPIKMKKWIARSTQELGAARSIIVPSEDTAKRIAHHFPKIKGIKARDLENDRADLSLEQLAYFSQMSIPDQDKHLKKSYCRFRVCIIGAIGIEKGFNIVQGLVKDSNERDLPLEFVIVGRTVDDRLFFDIDRIFITGTYQEEEAVALVKRQHADIAFFPAIWPETWCYALSIAWRSGLETVVFDLGAPAQRVKNTQRGSILSPLMTIPEINDMLLILCKKIRYKMNNN